MAATRTLAEMRQSARELADMEQSTFISDEWLTNRIDEHCQRLYDKLIIANGPMYYAKSNGGTATVSGQSLYTWAELAAPDFYRLVSLIVSDGNDFAELGSFDYTDLPYLLKIQESVGYVHVCQLRRQVRAEGIDIRPAPESNALTITLHYIPSMQRLTEPEQTFDGINGWERWVALGAAIDMRIKEETDPSGLYAQRSEMEKDIMQLASGRDAGRPNMIKRTRRRHWWRWGDDD
jgi:hypothetical protein